MTLKEAISILAEAGVPDAEYDARALFAHFGGLLPHQLVMRDARCDSPELIDALNRRAKREPLQYIIGRCDFYRESYFVTPDCLIPRQDSEILVDFAVKNLPRGAHFLDLCTGSGCIALSVLNNTDKTTAVAVDISHGALSLAKKNAERLALEDRIDLRLGDATKGVSEGEFFAVLSNPPYVTYSEYALLEDEIYFEPKGAFVGGEDGGDFYRAITPIYRDRIADSGFIAYEIGEGQAALLCEIAKANSMSCEIIPDLAGRARVAVLRRI